jgi:hypothetical protein
MRIGGSPPEQRTLLGPYSYALHPSIRRLVVAAIVPDAGFALTAETHVATADIGWLANPAHTRKKGSDDVAPDASERRAGANVIDQAGVFRPPSIGRGSH